VLASVAWWFGTSATAAAQDSLLQRPLIKGLSFQGNRALDDYTLSNSIATSNSSWWVRFPLVSWLGAGERRYFDEREFRRDVLRLKLFYSQAGYPDAVIDTVVRRAGDSATVQLVFLITEGEPVRVTDVTIIGTDGIVSPARLTRVLVLQPGDAFNRFLLGAATDTIAARLADRGYPFVDVFRSLSVDREARTASVSFEVAPGPRVVVGAVDVQGSEAIGADGIRRLVPLRAGRVYRRRDLLAAQRDLARTGAFDYVDVRLADTVPPGGDPLVTVRVAVREGRFHRIRASAGYGTEDCFRLLAGFSAARVLGGLRTFDVTARLSKIGTGEPFGWGLERNVCRALSRETDPGRLELNYILTAGLSEPGLLGRTVSGAVSVFAERRSEISAFVSEGVGGEVGLTWRTVGDVPVTLSYRLSRASTKASPASFCLYLNICQLGDIAVYQEPLLQASLGALVTRNRQNSVLDPTRGSLASAGIRWASPLIGSDTLASFTRLDGQIASYHRIGRRGVFAWRVVAGTVLARRVSVEGESRLYIPPEERFYSGGASSVRGFGQNELGPVVRVIDSLDTDGNGTPDTVQTLTSAAGGSDLVVANVELRLPVPGLGSRVQGAMFLDLGQVFDRQDGAQPDLGLRFTPGVGLRFLTGVGPIRLDVGYNPYAPRAGPLYRERGPNLELVEPSFAPSDPQSFWDRLRLHFSVGQAF
jgi:outer membrane protein insertion porin family/translocation and assembly module TamA